MIAMGRVVSGLLMVGVLAGCAGDERVSGPTGGPPRDVPVLVSSGGFLFRVITTGAPQDPDGYEAYVQPGFAQGFGLALRDSLLVSHAVMPVTPTWFVHLRGLESNCWVGLPNWRTVSGVVNQITRVDYNVECVPLSRMSTYDRVTPHHANSVAFHGYLTERYVLRDDGMFRLQYSSGRFGFFEYLGTFKQTAPGALALSYDGDGRWLASARLRADSLSVEYNDIMWMSDFESGVFVRQALSGPGH